MESKKRQQGQANGREIGGDHIHFAVGEIDHTDDAVHHGVADGDKTIDRTQR
ncbi:Uncharacterised protein [Enterobacter cloacae]|nr:Uncharacterised protein [Enterobacter cloacae]